MKKIYFIIIYYIFIYNFIFSFAFAQGKKEQVPFIFSESPQYSTSEFITLEEIHKIDVDVFEEYYIYQVRAMDSDSYTNLYVLDFYESTITVFDKNGKFIRTMGGKGQGPSEFIQPMSLSIINDKMYIYEENKGMKVLDLQCKYIDYFFVPLGNYYVFKAFDDFFLTVKIDYDRSHNRKYIVTRFSKDFNESYTVAEYLYKVNPKESFPISAQEIVAMNSKQHVYFPGNFEEYKVNVYSIEGNIIKSFGRKYKRIPYSKQTRQWREEFFKKSAGPYSEPTKVSKYPPVVRDILIDDRDYVWIIVGEWNRDCNNSFKVISTIDIFNENGEFLYTLEIPNIGLSTFIKNGRLYTTPSYDDMYIRVFKIHYNYEN